MPGMLLTPATALQLIRHLPRPAPMPTQMPQHRIPRTRRITKPLTTRRTKSIRTPERQTTRTRPHDPHRPQTPKHRPLTLRAATQ